MTLNPLGQQLKWNREEFGLLYSRHLDDLFGYVNSLLRNREETLDLLQSAFAKCWEKIPAEDIQNPKAWLFRVARNAAYQRLEHIERERRARGPVFRMRENLREDKTEEGDDLKAKLLAAIEELDLDKREIITLKNIKGFTFAEISGMTGVPLQTLNSRHRSALDLLKKKLEPS